MGTSAADALIEQTKKSIGVTSLDEPNELARFADELMKSGGIIEAVGRAIKIQAILGGARPPSDSGVRAARAKDR